MTSDSSLLPAQAHAGQLPAEAHAGQLPAEAHAGQKCGTVRDILSRLGDKWSVLTIVQLGAGSLRFGELQRRGHGISQRMLTHTLRQLERDGLVWRRVTPTVPLTVEYGLTPLGAELFAVLQPFFNWVDAQSEAIAAAQAAYDQRPRA